MIKVYGPYKRPDGRLHIVLYDTETGKKTTQSYPRYLMEQHLGRKLESWEHVDHINDDPTDNRLENFQILPHRDNVVKSKKPPEMKTFTCPTCGVRFEKRASRVRHNQLVQDKSGPYCSRRCAGKLGHSGGIWHTRGT